MESDVENNINLDRVKPKTAGIIINKALKILGVLTGFSLIGAFIGVWPTLGKRPESEYQERFRLSKNYNADKKIFENRIPDLMKKMNERVYKWKSLKEWFQTRTDTVPATRLPEVKPDMGKFLEPSSDIKVIWFGHSSFIMNLHGTIVLVDPVFSSSASPFSFIVKRFQAPVLNLSELPEVDYILISHDHFDHLDMDSIKFFADKKAKFVTPLGVGSHLKSWGITEERITEKDWWESVKFKGIEFIATPAQHFSGRTGIKPNTTLWASWVIRSRYHNIYFSGDSGYDIHFKQIGDKYGPFDVAFIESGQYNILWREVHMLPEEAAMAFNDLKAKKYFPIHWGMFKLALHPWYDPIERLFNMSKEKKINLITAKIGQIINVNKKQLLEDWWRSKEHASVFSNTPENKYGNVPIMENIFDQE